MHVYIYTHTCVYVCIRIHTSHTYAHVCRVGTQAARQPMCIIAGIHIYIYIYVYIYMCIYIVVICVYIYIYTYIYIYICIHNNDDSNDDNDEDNNLDDNRRRQPGSPSTVEAGVGLPFREFTKGGLAIIM